MIMPATEQVISRVPDELLRAATRAARRERPGISRAGTIRLALARLAGLPGDEYAANMKPGPKPRQRT